MITSNRRLPKALLLTAALLPSNARAQTATQSFTELQGMLRRGQMVVVTDESGRETQGKLAELSVSSLVIFTKEKTHDSRGMEHETWTAKQSFAEGAIKEIRRRDSLGNGALIGLAVGAIPAVVAAVVFGGACANEGGSCPAYSVGLPALFAGAGAAIGAGVDAMIGRHKVVYVSPPRTRALTFSPVFGRDRQGVLVSVRF